MHAVIGCDAIPNFSQEMTKNLLLPTRTVQVHVHVSRSCMLPPPAFKCVLINSISNHYHKCISRIDPDQIGQE